MDVDLTISFSKEEVLDMVRERLNAITPPVPGVFEATYYYGDVRATFKPSAPQRELVMSAPIDAVDV
jgi:hypothetical protein